MRRNILIVVVAAVLLAIFFKTRNSSDDDNGNYKDERVQRLISFFDSLPTASIETDTLNENIICREHQSGLIFCGIVGGNKYLLSAHSLYPNKSSVDTLSMYMKAGLEHGNYAVCIDNGKIVAVTAKHMLEENLSKATLYGWKIDSASDVMFADSVTAYTKHPSVLLRSSRNLDGAHVVVDGYRVYASRPYALHIKIGGVLRKVNDYEALNATSRPFAGHSSAKELKKQGYLSFDNIYVLKIPPYMNDEVMGLSGSGVYLVGVNGKVTDTLIGVQSDRVQLAEQDGESVRIRTSAVMITTIK